MRNGHVATFDSRGVADLFNLLNDDPEFMQGADVADKVVGKGAAALDDLRQDPCGICRCYQPTGISLVKHIPGQGKLRNGGAEYNKPQGRRHLPGGNTVPPLHYSRRMSASDNLFPN